MRSLVQDIRFAVRMLRKRPSFTLIAVATLALGIGVNTAIFSVFHGVLLRPLPYGEPDRLAEVWLEFRGDHGNREFPASEPEFLEFREATTAFEDVAAYVFDETNLGGNIEPRRVPVAWVSANFLQVLDVSPAVGRSFATHEDRPGHDAVAILSHGAWMSSFGGEAGIVGQTALVDGSPRTIIGVLPAGFVFPGAEASLLLPNPIDPREPAGRSSHYLSMLARLRDGISLDQARAEIDTIIARWAEEFPDRHKPSESHPIVAAGLHERIVGDVRPALIMLGGAVGLVLLVACTNVANLMLAHAEGRRREIGIRCALGASRLRLIRQSLTESCLIGLAGGGLGLLLAQYGVSILIRLGPDSLPRLRGIAINGPVLLFTLATSLLTGLLFGLAPALGALRTDPQEAFRDASNSTTTGKKRMHLRRLLVVSEIALAVMLVFGAGLFLKSLVRLQKVDPGFNADGVTTMDFSLTEADYPTTDSVARFHRELTARFEALPGVIATGAIRTLPIRGEPGYETLTLSGATGGPDSHGSAETPSWNAQYQVAGPGYFRALRIPLQSGRLFNDADRAGAQPVAIVNESMAKLFWPHGDVLGQRVKLGEEDTPNPEMTIVGIVGDVLQSGLDGRPGPQVFAPLQQAGAIYDGFVIRSSTFVVLAETDPASIARSVRAVGREIDPNLPLANVQTMGRVVSRSIADRQFLSTLMTLFSAVALILGAVGIYGVMAYSVARRTREIGIRMALGAGRGRLLGAVISQTLVLSAAGVLMGLAGAWAGGRVLRGMLFGVSEHDPSLLVATPLILTGAAVLAAWIPARRAASIDPVIALRSE